MRRWEDTSLYKTTLFIELDLCGIPPSKGQMMLITCECGNDTFKLAYTDGKVEATCTACERSEPLDKQPFTIRMPS